MDLRVLILPAKRDAEPVGCDTLDFEIEIAPKARIWRKAARSQAAGNEGVISKDLNPVGRMPNNPSVKIRQ